MADRDEGSSPPSSSPDGTFALASVASGQREPTKDTGVGLFASLGGAVSASGSE